MKGRRRNDGKSKEKEKKRNNSKCKGRERWKRRNMDREIVGKWISKN